MAMLSGCETRRALVELETDEAGGDDHTFDGRCCFRSAKYIFSTLDGISNEVVTTAG